MEILKDITYRKAILSDVLKLSILFKQVYIHAYAVEGVSDEYAHFITKHFSVERLEQIISNTPENIHVAVYKNNLLGVAELDFDAPCPTNNESIPELTKLYVLERFCGIGIGYHLFTEAEKAVKEKRMNGLWLQVWEPNARAISFYKRQHCKHIGSVLYPMEENTYTNLVMWKELE